MKLNCTFLFLVAGLPSVIATAQTSGVELDAMVSTGTPLPRTLFEQSQPISILDGEELKLRLQPTLGETLSGLPGVSSSGYAPGASRPVIRGLDADRVRILQNRSNTIDVSALSPDHAVSFDPFTIERVEVVRGPATLLYGPNAVGGVVNVLDRRIPEERIEGPWPVRGKFDARAGTVDDELSGAGMIEFGIGGLVIHLDAFTRETDDVHIPGYARSARIRRLEPLEAGEKEPRGTLPNSFSQSEGATVGGSYIWDGGFAGLSYSGYNANYGVVAERDVTAEDFQRRWDARMRLDQPIRGVRELKLNFSYSDYEHTEFEGSETGTIFENEGFDGRIEIVHEKAGPFEGAFGFQTQKSDFSALGEEAYVPPVETVQHSGFIFEEVALDPVRLQFGIRFDHTTLERSGTREFGPAAGREFNALSGAFGVVWDLKDGYSLAFSTSYSQRPPTSAELYANGPHIATSAFEIGDPNLGLEKALNFDLALRKQTGWVTGSVGVFYTHFRDFIALQATGDFSEEESEEDHGEEGHGDESLPIFAYEALGANFLGAELELTFHLIEPRKAPDAKGPDGKTLRSEPGRPMSLDLELKADYVYAEERGSHTPLSRIPPFRASAGLVYRWDRFSARIEGRYAARQNRTSEFELPTDSYFLLNAAVEYTVPVGQTELNFYVRGTNLTNAEARLHTSFLKEIAPLPGAGVLFGVQATF